MAKNNTELAEKQATPLAMPAEMRGRLADLNATDLELPVLHLFQDVGKESDLYGSHPKGTWVDGLTKEAMTNPEFAALKRAKGFEVWYARNSAIGKGFVARFDRLINVPDEFQQDKANYDVVETVTWLVALIGQPMPYAVRFKSTALRAARTLATIEVAREQSGKPLGIHKLGSIEKSNEKGKWFVPDIRGTRDVRPEEVDAVLAMYRMVTAASTVTVREPGDDDGGGDGIPI